MYAIVVERSSYTVFHAVITIFAKPDRRDEMVHTMCSIVEPTEAEPGCLRCGCYCGAHDPNELLFLERWRSREDFERHVRSGHFRVLLSVVDLSAKEPNLTLDEICATDDLAYVDRVLSASGSGEQTSMG